MLDGFLRRGMARRLADDLADAKEVARLAKARFDEIHDSIPSGIPAPDSNLQIKQASAHYKRSLAELDVALERWVNFVAKGIVPDGFS